MNKTKFFYASLFTALLLLGTSDRASKTFPNGMEYTAFGDTSVEGTWISGLGDSGSGIEIETGDNREWTFEFEPIDLDKGSAFTLASYAQDGVLLASMDLVQTGERQTEVWLNLNLSEYIDGNTITLFARDHAGIGHEVIVPVADRTKIGTVDAETSAWAETWDLICIDGECSWVIDPEDTTIEFEDLPGVSIPFHYLGVSVPVLDAADVRSGRVVIKSIQ